MAEVFQALPIPPVTIRVNHRRLVEGFLRGLGATDVAAGLRALDKLAKAGPVAVSDSLRDDAGLTGGGGGPLPGAGRDQRRGRLLRLDASRPSASPTRT